MGCLRELMWNIDWKEIWRDEHFKLKNLNMFQQQRMVKLIK